MQEETLTKYDEVLWRGGWGKDPEQIVRVEAIQVNECNGSKEGVLVDSISWAKVTERNVILMLANGSWCWAFQATPYYGDEDVKLTGDDEPVDRDDMPDKYQDYTGE